MKTLTEWIMVAKVNGEWVGVEFSLDHGKTFVSLDGLNESRQEDFSDSIGLCKSFKARDLLFNGRRSLMNRAMAIFLTLHGYITAEEEREQTEKEQREATLRSYFTYSN